MFKDVAMVEERDGLFYDVGGKVGVSCVLVTVVEGTPEPKFLSYPPAFLSCMSKRAGERSKGPVVSCKPTAS